MSDGHTVDVVLVDIPQTTKVAPDNEAIAIKVEFIILVYKTVLAFTEKRICVGEILFQR